MPWQLREGLKRRVKGASPRPIVENLDAIPVHKLPIPSLNDAKTLCNPAHIADVPVDLRMQGRPRQSRVHSQTTGALATERTTDIPPQTYSHWLRRPPRLHLPMRQANTEALFPQQISRLHPLPQRPPRLRRRQPVSTSNIAGKPHPILLGQQAKTHAQNTRPIA